MSEEERETLVKITSVGTISIPKQFRKYMDMQRGDYVRIVMSKDGLVIKKANIT
jgi:AbrB family looped-hinge helix DNA binding protein